MGEALQGLHRVCADVRFLGSYPRAVAPVARARPAAHVGAARDLRRRLRRLRRLARPPPLRHPPDPPPLARS